VKKILIVDDEEDILAYLTTLFKDNGYETMIAHDGKEALAMMKKEKPDLVTLDIIMPKESGVRFYRDVKEDDELKNIPIIIITALTGWGYDPDGFHKFIKSRKQVPPPEGFLSKPVDREELLKIVKAHLS
jgi:DNA-binding response OmpR family regulator